MITDGYEMMKVIVADDLILLAASLYNQYSRA